MINYPAIDRSNIIPEEHREYGYGEGTLKDGRPFRIEGWFEQGFTYLSYYLPIIDIDDHNPEDLKEILVSEGLVSFDDKKFLSSGFSSINLSANKISDASGNELWEFTIIVGDEDGTYVKSHVPLKKYTFPYQVGLNSDKYFIGLCEADIYYIPYFVNNSNKLIEIMVEREKFEYRNIFPKRYVRLEGIYESWWFDWSNQINLNIKYGDKNLKIGFLMEKGFPFRTKKIDKIPVLNRSGWICK
jgi:hypothetical protein